MKESITIRCNECGKNLCSRFDHDYDLCMICQIEKNTGIQLDYDPDIEDNEENET